MSAADTNGIKVACLAEMPNGGRCPVMIEPGEGMCEKHKQANAEAAYAANTIMLSLPVPDDLLRSFEALGLHCSYKPWQGADPDEEEDEEVGDRRTGSRVFEQRESEWVKKVSLRCLFDSLHEHGFVLRQCWLLKQAEQTLLRLEFVLYDGSDPFEEFLLRAALKAHVTERTWSVKIWANPPRNDEAGTILHCITGAYCKPDVAYFLTLEDWAWCLDPI